MLGHNKNIDITGLPFCFQILKASIKYRIDALIIKSITYNDLIALIIELTLDNQNKTQMTKANSVECDNFL